MLAQPIHQVHCSGGSCLDPNVPGDFAPDRGTTTATATSAGVRRSIVMRSQAIDGRSTLGLADALVALVASRLSCRKAENA
jgi:hypothetical protein